MKIVICIDDTDNEESRGTGQVATLLGRSIEETGLGKVSDVTRHQLLVHPDIPYTSHNSAMCFTAEIAEANLDAVIQLACAFMDRECAEGSDPGLCIAPWERLNNNAVVFGFAAKTQVLRKAAAYALAQELGIHLSEHGGTGDGVIGALAGAGLRFSGQDGKFKTVRGTKDLKGVYRVGDLYAQTGIESVRALDGRPAQEDDMIEFGDSFRAMLRDGKVVVFAAEVPEQKNANGVNYWRAYDKQFIKRLERPQD